MNLKYFIIITLLLTACTPTEIYFCPEDNCQKEVLKELGSAKNEIKFMIYSFTDHTIAEMLIYKGQKIDVEGIVEKDRITSKFHVYNALIEGNITTILDKNRATMHNKIGL
jgi:hypothetical protein